MQVLVSLVGAGPGDPSLLTLAAVRALQRADVVLYDALIHPAVLDHARPEATRVFVGKRAGHEGTPQDAINALLIEHARAGRVVCRLKGGDPFLFGRGSEEAEVLAAAGIPFEVVPGVSAAVGATAYAGIPLTHRHWSSSVAFITSSEHAAKSTSAHDWAKLATATQTLVIFMGVRKLRDEMARLISYGRAAATPVAVIQSGTRSDQRVVLGTLGDIAQRCEESSIGPPALVVVGEVARLRESLRWWDRGTLFGKRVLVTRARSQAGGLASDLMERGAEPVIFSAIDFAPPSDPSLVASAIAGVNGYDLAVFTSANGVERWFAAMDSAGLDARALGRAKVVAIGPATADSLARRGIRADAIPPEFRGEGAAATAIALFASPSGKRALIARAEVAREALPDALRTAGMQVDIVPVYRTVPAAHDDSLALRASLAAGEIDAITFTSSSTVDHLCDALGEDVTALLAPVVVVSIGPITSEAARRRGLHVTVEAGTYTVPGLLKALEEHYSAKESK